MDAPETLSVTQLASLPLHSYTHLSQPDIDIRVIELLPGENEQEIRIKLHHIQLAARSSQSPERSREEDIQANLPSDWKVLKTIHGRFLFWDPNARQFGWNHPDPEFNQPLYEEESLDEVQTEYEALSYTWGTEPPSAFLIVEGATRTKMPVRPNLLGALKQLRDPERPRNLWIDAICINQDDNVEKSVQVGRMADIYRLAHRVVVWLGPEDADSKLALSALREIGRQYEVTVDGYLLPSPDATNPEWCVATTVLPFDKRTWVAVTKLLERVWFERLWVIQEFQLGNSRSLVQCGEDTIPFPLFRGGVSCVFYRRPVPPGISKVTVRWAHRVVSPWNRYNFWNILSAAQSRKCADPRDTIYGILSLLPKRLAAEIRPDYTKNAVEVFKSAFLSHANHVKRFELFSQCSSVNRQSGTPSWVPDWTGGYTDVTGVTNQFASGCSQAEFSFTSPDILTVTGLQCAQVSEVLDLVPKRGTDAQKIRIIRSWQPEDFATGVYVNGESLKMAHAKTLFFNRMKERSPMSFVPTEAEWAAQKWDCPLFGDNLVDVADSYQIPPSCRDSLRSIRRCSGRRYIKTVEGYIGLAPHNTQAGEFHARHSFSLPIADSLP